MEIDNFEMARALREQYPSLICDNIHPAFIIGLFTALHVDLGNKEQLQKLYEFELINNLPTDSIQTAVNCIKKGTFPPFAGRQYHEPTPEEKAAKEKERRKKSKALSECIQKEIQEKLQQEEEEKMRKLQQEEFFITRSGSKEEVEDFYAKKRRVLGIPDPDLGLSDRILEDMEREFELQRKNGDI